MYSLIVLEAQSKNQGVGRAMPPWKALGENHSWPHFWWPWGFLALWLPHSTDRPLSSVSSFPVPIRTPLTGFRTSLYSPRVISNQYRQYLSRSNLITDVSVIFFQIRPHSQVPTIKSWTYLLRGQHSTLSGRGWVWALLKWPKGLLFADLASVP